MPNTILAIPPKDRFSLPEVLEHLKPLGCTREDLFDYLRLGRLKAVCFPYRLEPDREIAIEPNEWPEWFREAWQFPVYWGWIGDTNKDCDARVPLHIVPRTAGDDCTRKLHDGGPAATSATVYVLRGELVRFSKWLRNARKSRPGPRRKGAGRPVKYDYSQIDACLELLMQRDGRGIFARPRDVIVHLEQQLGRTSLPHDSTLRNHLKVWLAKHTAASSS